MVKRKKTPHLNKKEVVDINPWLEKPTDDIEQNLAEGIDEVVPDPDDVPGGVNPDLTSRPDLAEATMQALLEKKESLRMSTKRKRKKK